MLVARRHECHLEAICSALQFLANVSVRCTGDEVAVFVAEVGSLSFALSAAQRFPADERVQCAVCELCCSAVESCGQHALLAGLEEAMVAVVTSACIAFPVLQPWCDEILRGLGL